METKEWLESLKPGDLVAFNGNYGALTIRVVDRLTKKQIVLDNGSKFWIDGGYGVGCNIWNHASISPITDEVKEKIRTGNLKYKISRVDFEKLSNDKKERILAIVNEAENGQTK